MKKILPFFAPVPLKTEFAFGYIDNLGDGLTRLLVPVFTIAGTAVVFYFLVGAIKYITSGGNKDSVKSANEMITHAIIGFILLMMLFLVLQFLPPLFGLTGFQIIKP